MGLSDVSGLWRSGCGGGGRLRRGKSGTGSLPSAQRGGKAAPGTVGVDVALDRYDRQRPFLYPAGRDGPHHHYGLYSGSAGSLRGGKGSDLAHALASVWKF